MEELDISNILSPEEIDGLFEDTQENTQETSPEKKENEPAENTEKEATEEFTEGENPFESPESVGSGKEETKEKEDTMPEGPGSSPNKTNFYSSIASALKEDGIFQNLDDDKAKGITDAESFAQAIRDEVSAQFDERQKRIDDALNAGIEPSEIQKYERTLEYLDSIKEEHISDESEKGEALRKQLIYNDFINRGYSKERANREVKKSFDAGTDIEDAKESLKSNREFFSSSYNNMVKQAQEEEKAYEERRKKDAETLRKEMLEDDKAFSGITIDKGTRQKAFEAISKPVYKDPETGELFTAVQRYEMDNHKDFLKNIGLLYVLTDGFKSLDKLVKGETKKAVKSHLRALEERIQNTSRDSDGNIRLADDLGNESSFFGEGWKLDLNAVK